MDIVWLGEEACNNCEYVGGKAANLSILNSTQQVPPGFCITAKTFLNWSSNLVDQKCPEQLKNLINDAYQKLANKVGISVPEVAVRSSAIDEDGGQASFAGQYETYLNIKGIDSLVDAIMRCWKSSNLERVQQYRKEQGKSLDVPLAVLVQQQIRSDVSMVVFTVDPVTKNNQNIVINSNWGLGESLVSGSVTPDTYIVEKESLKIVKQDIAKKEYMTILDHQSIKQVKVPRIMSTESSMSEEKIIKTAKLSLDLENHFGYAVDVECCWQGDQLYLLQCRPITTIS